MFIYELESEYFNPHEEDINFMYEYVVHDKEFSKEEFEKMCHEGLETVLEGTAFELREFLILNYGFKKLPIKHRFGFSESE